MTDIRQPSNTSHLLCIAPMLGYTDRHFRYLIRLITQHAFLYTEMIVAQALLHQNADRFLQYHEIEHPIAAQLAGNEPHTLAKAAQLVEKYLYDEVNFNVGCPSSRVQAGQFGCCLMKQPNLVADCIKEIQDAVSIPLTVKTRLGLIEDKNEANDCDTLPKKYRQLFDFIHLLSECGCKTFIIHARFAHLTALTPRQNRSLPPLHDEIVRHLKNDFPDLEIIFNGGIQPTKDIRHILTPSQKTSEIEAKKEKTAPLDGVMIGQAAYHHPYSFIDVDEMFYGDTHAKLSREQIVEQYMTYVEHECKQGVPRQKMLRHLPHLFWGTAHKKSRAF